jgi:hypothetical protein
MPKLNAKPALLDEVRRKLAPPTRPQDARTTEPASPRADSDRETGHRQTIAAPTKSLRSGKHHPSYFFKPPRGLKK